jgi:hypothetical protein
MTIRDRESTLFDRIAEAEEAGNARLALRLKARQSLAADDPSPAPSEKKTTRPVTERN